MQGSTSHSYLLKNKFFIQRIESHTDIKHVLKNLFYSHDIKELGRYNNQFKVKVETAQIYMAKRNMNRYRIGAGSQLNH